LAQAASDQGACLSKLSRVEPNHCSMFRVAFIASLCSVVACLRKARKTSRGEFSQECKLYPKKRVVLVTVSSNYVEMFKNWELHAREFIRDTEQLHVIAEDGDAVGPLEEMQRTSHFELTAPATQKANYREVAWRRPSHILRFLREGCSVLFADIDTVWMNDPFLDIGEASLADIHVTFDDVPERKNYCGCFMYVQPTARLQEFMQDWAEPMKNTLASGNQGFFNQVIKDAKTSGNALDMEVLPFEKYPPGKFAQNFSSVATILHANWLVGISQKVAFFQTYGLWSMGNASHAAPSEALNFNTGR